MADKPTASGFDYLMAMEVLKHAARDVLLAHAERDQGRGNRIDEAISRLSDAVRRADQLVAPLDTAHDDEPA